MPDPFKIVINAVSAQPIVLAPQVSSGQKLTILQGPITIVGTQLVPATNSTLGGIIVGSNLSITNNGVLSANIPPGGVTAFNNRTGDVALTANDVFSAARDSGKSNLSMYVPMSTIGLGLTTSTANYNQNSSSIIYRAYANCSVAPLYKDANIWVNGSVNLSVGGANANIAANSVGTFRVQFQSIANATVFSGNNSKFTGFELTHYQGTPYLRMIGQPQAAAWIDVANIPATFMLTKEQCMLFFMTQGLADQLYEPKRKVNA